MFAQAPFFILHFINKTMTLTNLHIFRRSNIIQQFRIVSYLTQLLTSYRASILLLTIVGNHKVQRWVGLQKHNAQIKFHVNRPTDAALEGGTDRA